MRARTIGRWAGVLLTLAAHAACANEAGRVRFNDDWRFHPGDAPGAGDVPIATVRGWLAEPASNPPADFAFAAAAFDDAAWRSLRLPHDWAIEGPFVQELPGETGKRPFVGVGWYRKTFDVADADAGKLVFLDFDGAMSHACVWVNGRFAGGWPYGYASFRIDATPHLKPGRNVVAVRLQNPPESSRWYPGAGLYRGVWLTRASPLHVGHWGVTVTTPEITDAAATVRTEVIIRNDADRPAKADARVELFETDAAGTATGPAVADGGVSIDVGPRAEARPQLTLRIDRPKRWSVDGPHRYVARVQLQQDGKETDRYDQPFGVRTAVFTADRGLLVNGQPLPLRGVCEHHDLGALGGAFNTRAMQRKLEILKSMGVNALRTSHNPPAPELLDLCDAMGVVVLDEAFDCWHYGKKRNDYSGLFDAWHERDLRALVRRDRNHPSVVAWSIGNEIMEQGKSRAATTQRGIEIGTRLSAIVKEEDPTRPTTAAYDIAESAFDGMQHTVDVMGFNYKPWLYARFRAGAATQPYMGTETASTISSRGEYVFPVSDDPRGGQANFHMSSYDLYAPPWATTPDKEFAAHDANPSVAGEFVWTGFDYLGEPTPYNRDVTNLLNFSDPAERAKAEAEIKRLGKVRPPSRSSYFGIVDLAGFPKERFYLYQSRWRPDLPMVHVLPHWTWPDRVGQVTPVHVYTSGDAAELFLNGRSLGRKTKAPGTYRLRWDDVLYEPGELKIVATKDGKPWAEETVKTAGPATGLTLAADRAAIAGDGDDLSFVTLRVTDAAGGVVPRAAPRVTFTIDGPGELVATDNGNPIDPASFQSPDRAAFNGLALAIVRGKRGATGPVTLTATAEGLAPATARIDVK